MANATGHHHGNLLYHRGLLSASEFVSQRTALTLVLVLFLSFLWQGFRRRKFYRNLPGPPHSLLFGHLPAMIEATRKFPADGHPAMSFVYLMNKYNLWSKDLNYIDTYPLVNDNVLIATTPEAAAEITERNFVRHPFMTNFYGRIIGIKSMTLAEGHQWKEMRKTFNPGFSLTNVMTLMPDIVKQGEILVAKLSNIAKSGGYAESLDELVRCMTLDIIFRVVLGLDTNTQYDPKGNEVGNLLENMSQWMGNPQSMNPLRKLNLPKWIMLWWNERKIKRILTAAILKRWELVKENQAELKPGGKASRDLKLVIDLALKHYRDENVENEAKFNTLSDDYLDTLSDNIKAFIFGGHDTTASSISYTLYELSRNPDILEMVRQEHTDVFGPDLDTVSASLLEKPHLVNQLPITIAVIKETLRLYPPAGALRLGETGSSLTLKDQAYPLTSQLLWVAHPVLFRSPLEFPSPNRFLPQRFLPADFLLPQQPSSSPSKPSSPPGAANPHSQAINPDAYRPFERGSRNCIGQELALLELKVVLALVVRKFSFHEAYDEHSVRRAQSRSGARWFGRGAGVAVKAEAVTEVQDWGGKAYYVSLASNKPKDGIPVWVKEELGQEQEQE